MSLANSDFGDAGFDDGLEMPLSAESSEETQPTAPVKPSYRKQGFSIYSVMLILSFVFLITAIIFLFMEVDRFSS